jgi:hypothetical protein
MDGDAIECGTVTMDKGSGSGTLLESDCVALLSENKDGNGSDGCILVSPHGSRGGDTASASKLASGIYENGGCTPCQKLPSWLAVSLAWVVIVFAGANVMFCALSRISSAPSEGGTLIVPPRAQHSNQSFTIFLTDRQLERVHNYKAGSGLILHLHLTHHGGTSFCHTLGIASGQHSPDFACRIDSYVDQLGPALTSDPRFMSRVPWHWNETQSMIELIRPFYHMISFEFGFQLPPFPLQETDWENPNLLSVFITRNPLERLLSGDGYVSSHYSIFEENATIEDWWDYANATDGLTDNFMLRVLSNSSDCCQGSATPPQRLQEAMDLLSRFTFILNVDCLDEGMEALASVLGIDGGNSIRTNSDMFHNQHPPLESRFPFPPVYDFLRERNNLDIKLYEWTRERSLVNCDALKI